MGYFHVVFTLPHEFSALALQNKKLIYGLLFRASAETLLEVAANPKRLGAKIGFLSILHTWGQNLLHHPHVHCVVPAGGLSPDHQRWIHSRPNFLLPIPVLKNVFRGKFLDGLRRLFRAGKLVFDGRIASRFLRKAFCAFLKPLGEGMGGLRQGAVSRSRPPAAIPGPYTHRVAISNHRLSPSMARRSPSAGRTTPTATRSAR